MKLVGNKEIEDSLERLDRLTQEEAQMASAEQLKMTYDVDGKVTRVDDRVRGVDGRVQDVGNKVQNVNERVKGIDSNVRGLDDKLDQANRSLSFQFLVLVVIPWAQTASQGTTSEIVFYDGFLPQIHPRIIILHAKPITTARLNGFSKELYSIPGNLLAPSCGCTENVGYS